MTRNAVAQKLSDSNTTTSEEKRMYYPVSASEAYNLGIELEKILSNVYRELETKCNSTSARKVLKDLVKQNQEDIKNFQDGFNYALNCEIGNFYRTNGAVISYDSIEKEIASTKPLIIRNLENFIRKTESLQHDIKNTGSNDIGEYFNTKNSTEVLEVGLKVRENSSELYQRLAKLYPEGTIRFAFEDMAEVIIEGSNKIRQKF